MLPILVILVLLTPVFVARPARTALPLYAALVPAGSVIAVSFPLPPPFNTLSSFLGAIVIVSALAHLVLHRRARVPSLPVASWLALLAWISLTILWAVDLEAAQETAVIAWPLMLLLLSVALIRTDEADLDAVRVAMIVGSIAIGAYLLFLISIGTPLASPNQRFAISSGAAENDPNILAASLVLPLAVSLERLLLGGSRWLSSRGWRLLGAAGTIFTFIAIASTGSRGGLIGAAAAVAVVLISSARFPEARRIVRRTALALVGTALVLTLVAIVGPRIAPRGGVAALVNSPPIQRIHSPELGGSGRVEIWTAGIQLCRRHCGVGSGLGTFVSAFDQVFAFSGALINIGPNRPAHSIYLELAVEAGLIGLGLLALALLAEWRAMSGRRATRASPALQGALIGLLITSAFLSTLWFKYFWLLPVMMRLAEGAHRERTSPEPVEHDRQLVAQPA